MSVVKYIIYPSSDVKTFNITLVPTGGNATEHVLKEGLKFEEVPTAAQKETFVETNEPVSGVKSSVQLAHAPFPKKEPEQKNITYRLYVYCKAAFTGDLNLIIGDEKTRATTVVETTVEGWQKVEWKFVESAVFGGYSEFTASKAGSKVIALYLEVEREAPNQEANKMKPKLTPAALMRRNQNVLLTAKVSFEQYLSRFKRPAKPNPAIMAFAVGLSFRATPTAKLTYAKKLLALIRPALAKFEAPKILDTFKRVEKPLSNGGKWTKLNRCTTAGETNTLGYKATSTEATEDGAYWNPETFLYPTTSINVANNYVKSGGPRLYACMSEPNTANESGYRLRCEETSAPFGPGGGETEYTFFVERIDKGVVTLLAKRENVVVKQTDDVALFVTPPGFVEAYHKNESAGYMFVCGKEDTTYSEGFVGVGAKGQGFAASISEFEAQSYTTILRRQTVHQLKGITLTFRGILNRVQRLTASIEPKFVKMTGTIVHQLTASVTPFLARVFPSMRAALSFAITLPRNTSHTLKATLFGVDLLDTFKRSTEKPLSNGGKWALISECKRPGEITASEDYGAETVAGEEDGAYWTLREYIEPTVQAELDAAISVVGRFNALYACLREPALSRTGYILRVTRQTVANKYTLALSKYTEGEVTSLGAPTEVLLEPGDHYGLRVRAGKVISRRKKGALGEWEAIQEIADSTFTKGYVGVGARGNGSTHARNFEVEGFVILGRNITHQLFAVLEFLGTLRKELAKKLEASLSFVGFLGRAISHGLSAASSFSAFLGKAISRKTQAELNATGELNKRSKHELFASLSFVAALSRTIIETLRAFLFAVNGGPVVIGSTSKGAGNLTPTNGKITAFQTEATATGTVIFLNLPLSATFEPAASTPFTELGIYAENAGEPGALIGSGKMKLSVGGKYTALEARVSIPVTSGTKYWLAIITPGKGTDPTPALPITSPGTATIKGTEKATFKSLAEGFEFEKPAKTFGPMDFYGTVIPSATFLGHNVTHQLAAVLSFVGSLFPRIKHALQATVSFVGFLGKNISRKASATLQFEKELGKDVTHALSSSVSFVGSLFEDIRETLTASLSFAVTEARNVTHQLQALLEFKGFLEPRLEQVIVRLMASLEFAVTQARNITHQLRATLEFVATIGSKVQKLMAELTFAVTQSFTTKHQLPASLSFVGFLGKAISRALSASLSFAVQMFTTTTHALSATVSFSAFLGKNIKHQLAASISFAASMTAHASHALQATLEFSAFLQRHITHQLSAALTFKTSMEQHFTERLAAMLTFTGYLGKNISHKLRAHVGIEAELGHNVVHQLRAMLTFAASLNRRTTHQLTAALSFFVTTNRNIVHQLFAELRLRARLGQATQKLEASLEFAEEMSVTVKHQLSGAMSFFVTTNRAIVHQLFATLEFFTRLNPSRTVVVPLRATLSFSVTLGRHIGHQLRALLKLSAELDMQFYETPVKLFGPIVRFFFGPDKLTTEPEEPSEVISTAFKLENELEDYGEFELDEAGNKLVKLNPEFEEHENPASQW